MAPFIIETQGLGCRSGNRFLLKDIDWQVEQGQHWVVFGMNGSGKTTLLSIIAGFKKATHGTLRVFGEPYSSENILRQRRRIGLVSSAFFDRYYHRESALHIVLSGKFGTFGLDSAVSDQDVKLAKALLRELHLPEKINQPFDLMSRGERQNVLIARALFARPEILVLDEPCTGLDIFNREHLLHTVRELAGESGMTVIYVTHYTDEILEIFQHSLLLKHGRSYAQGATEEMLCGQSLSAFLDYPVSVRQETGRIQVSMAVSSNVRALLAGGEPR